MDRNEFNNILSEIIKDSYVCEINHYQDFALILKTKSTRGEIPSTIRILLQSDWIIPSVGEWSYSNDFPLDESKVGEPFESQKAYYLFYITQLGGIKGAFLDESDNLNIIFADKWSILVKATSDYADEAWVIDANEDKRFPNFRYAYSCFEKRIY